MEAAQPGDGVPQQLCPQPRQPVVADVEGVEAAAAGADHGEDLVQLRLDEAAVLHPEGPHLPHQGLQGGAAHTAQLAARHVQSCDTPVSQNQPETRTRNK